MAPAPGYSLLSGGNGLRLTINNVIARGGGNSVDFINLIEGGSLTIRNSVVEGFARFRALSVRIGADVTIEDSIFRNNTGATGAAMYFTTGDNFIRRSLFENNSASVAGGAVFVDGGAVTFEDSSFINNSASDDGGAFVIDGTVRIRNSAFVGNSAVEGGAVHVLGSFSTTAHEVYLEHVTVTGNTSTNSSGGAVQRQDVTSVNTSEQAACHQLGHHGQYRRRPVLRPRLHRCGHHFARRRFAAARGRQLHRRRPLPARLEPGRTAVPPSSARSGAPAIRSTLCPCPAAR